MALTCCCAGWSAPSAMPSVAFAGGEARCSQGAVASAGAAVFAGATCDGSNQQLGVS